jgi:hypothetical protein
MAVENENETLTRGSRASWWPFSSHASSQVWTNLQFYYCTILTRFLILEYRE